MRRQRLRRHAESLDKEVNFLRFRRKPWHIRPTQHIVQAHQLSRDLGGAPLPSVPIVFVANRAIERAGVEVINVPTIGAGGKSIRQVPLN
jgi:hypothetical protein